MKFNFNLNLNLKDRIKISEIKSKITEFYNIAKIYSLKKYEEIKKEIAATKVRMDNDVKEKNRILILALSALFVLDYMMLSYHIDKNIFDIFPSIPVLEDKKTVNIYIPSEGCKEILAEKREIYSDLEDESLVRRLFDLVADGSYFENTSENVPVNFLIKKIWLVDGESGEGKVCVIDLSPAILEKDMNVVKGSEQMFKESLEKTITENIPGIKKVILLEKGVPFRKLWEI
ncbi:MAG TPA: GerMN domain-containing protein [Spirochaetota bacterium]|nr:GerMN domain-containing protein [Spirochaetota bacterium]HPS86863.1 GerMN domain-containing protein [Spirochaetota bacterium]